MDQKQTPRLSERMSAECQEETFDCTISPREARIAFRQLLLQEERGPKFRDGLHLLDLRQCYRPSAARRLYNLPYMGPAENMSQSLIARNAAGAKI